MENTDKKYDIIKSIIIWALTIIIIYLLTIISSPIKEDMSKYGELKARHMTIIDTYKKNEGIYINKINNLKDSIKNNKKIIYNTKIKYIYEKNNNTDTNCINIINTCDEYIDGLIKESTFKDSIITTNETYIDQLNNTIKKQDTLITESNELYKRATIDNTKLKRKLRRTRILGVIGTVTGFIGGLIIK